MPRSLVAFLVVFLIAAALFVKLAHVHITLAVVIILACAPVLAWFFAPALFESIGMLIKSARRSAHGAWQGNFYSYDGQHIRFFKVDDVAWVAEADIAKVIHPAATERECRLLGEHYGVIPGQSLKGYTEAGMERLMRSRTDSRHSTPEMIRFKGWLEREAFPNVRRLPRSSA
jgi:hypothetical protein